MSALHLDFYPLTDKNYHQFMAIFDHDNAKTLYDKPTLRNKIEMNFKSLASDKIHTLIILNSKDATFFGFVCYQDKGETLIHDMYTFEPGRDNKLFNLIGHVFTKEFNLKGFHTDENSEKLANFFKSAQKPLENNQFTYTLHK